MLNDIYKDFPLITDHLENGKSLVYLDSAATAQKPACVINAIERFYRESVANPHRGAYALSADATELYEGTRKKAADFIGAAADEIIFTKNTSDSINLVSKAFGEVNLKAGDEVLISIAEHHSNLLPWQALCHKVGARLEYIYLDSDYKLSMRQFKEKLNERTKIVSIAQISNVLGIENPIEEMVKEAHKYGAVFVMDAAQSVPHMPVNVSELDVDFMAFSAHKMMGPNGIGVLYVKKALLEKLDPITLGGGIVEEVTEQTVRFVEGPLRFEAGTPNVEGAVGLTAAIDYINSIGIENIQKKELELTKHLLEGIKQIHNIKIYGSDNKATGIVAFNVNDVHPHDVASILDNDGVTIRAGHHCAQPLMRSFDTYSCCRVSLYLYNTKQDIEQFLFSLRKVREVLGFGA